MPPGGGECMPPGGGECMPPGGGGNPPGGGECMPPGGGECMPPGGGNPPGGDAVHRAPTIQVAIHVATRAALHASRIDRTLPLREQLIAQRDGRKRHDQIARSTERLARLARRRCRRPRSGRRRRSARRRTWRHRHCATTRARRRRWTARARTSPARTTGRTGWRRRTRRSRRHRHGRSPRRDARARRPRAAGSHHLCGAGLRSGRQGRVHRLVLGWRRRKRQQPIDRRIVEHPAAARLVQQRPERRLSRRARQLVVLRRIAIDRLLVRVVRLRRVLARVRAPLRAGRDGDRARQRVLCGAAIARPQRQRAPRRRHHARHGRVDDAAGTLRRRRVEHRDAARHRRRRSGEPAQLVKSGEKLERVGEAPLRVLLEQAQHQLVQVAPDPGLDRAGRRRHLAQVLGQDHAVAHAVERRPAAHELEQDAAQRVQIGPVIDAVAAVALLGSHVRCPEAGFLALAPQPLVALEQPGHAEVEDLGPLAARHVRVGYQRDAVRLEPAVDDADLVGRIQRARHLPRDGHGLLERELPLAPQPRTQRLALEALHHQICASVPRVAAVDHLDDAGMLDAGGGLRLAQELRDGGRVAAQLGRQHLDRRLAADQRVLGQIHGAHLAGADLAGDAVVADNLSDLHRRSISRSAARARSRPGTQAGVPAGLARRCPAMPAPGVPRDRAGRETPFG